MPGSSIVAQAIRDFPKQFAQGLAAAAGPAISIRGVQEVLITGMGGNALAAELLAGYLGPELRVSVSSDYVLDPKPDPRTLVLAASYSGTTEETLAAFGEAARSRSPLVAVSHGGPLRERARDAGVPHVSLPQVPEARFATGLLFAAMVGILERVGAIIDRTPEIRELGEFLAALDLEDTGKGIVEAIGAERVPVIYASARFRTVAKAWKLRINENAKTQAFVNVFPELNHNEMAGWARLRMPPVFLLLRSPDDRPETRRRMEVFAALMREQGNAVHEVEIPRAPFLFQAFATLQLGDWMSYHLALRTGVDPASLPLVDEFKRRLRG